MEFAYIFMVSMSLAVLGVLFVHALKRLHMAGTKEFLAQIVLVYVWSAGALLEMLAHNEPQILFWRNVQQIGVFGIPVTCVHFAAAYGRYERWKRYLPLFWIVPVAAVALIFTDQSHHIMRTGHIVSYSQSFGRAVSVEFTAVGMLFVAYNFTIVAVSLVMLGLFAAKVSSRMRKQVMMIMTSFFLVFLFAIIKTAFLERTGINVPIAALCLPSSLVMFLALFRHKLFMISPIAREKVFDVLDQGIVVTDDMGMIVDRNPYAILMMNIFFGIGHEIVGKSIGDVFAAYPQWINQLSRGEIGQLELQSPKDDADVKYLRIKVHPVLSESGKTIGAVSLLRDVTERRLHERKLRSMADQDSLTGLLNRNGFLRTFRGILSQAGSNEQAVSVLMIDMDRLKQINDTYGHFSGDRALLSMADVLRRTLRQQDVIGRIGGDEFAVALPGLCSSAAAAIADRILREARAADVEMENGHIVSASLSIGICDNRVPGGGAEKLLKLADKAMYMAKRQSRDCCVVWAPGAELRQEGGLGI